MVLTFYGITITMPTLTFSIQNQGQSNWCWAAVAVSTHLFYGGNQWTSQCQLVDQELQQTTCCQNGVSPACNKPWYLNKALQTTGNLHHYNTRAGSWGDVMQQINGQHPLGVRIGLNGRKNGHFLIINGYNTTPSGQQNVVIRDPLHGNSVVPHANLINGNYPQTGQGKWTDSFFTC
jgi:hypothetical protein